MYRWMRRGGRMLRVGGRNCNGYLDSIWHGVDIHKLQDCFSVIQRHFGVNRYRPVASRLPCSSWRFQVRVLLQRATEYASIISRRRCGLSGAVSRLVYRGESHSIISARLPPVLQQYSRSVQYICESGSDDRGSVPPKSGVLQTETHLLPGATPCCHPPSPSHLIDNLSSCCPSIETPPSTATLVPKRYYLFAPHSHQHPPSPP